MSPTLLFLIAPTALSLKNCKMIMWSAHYWPNFEGVFGVVHNQSQSQRDFSPFHCHNATDTKQQSKWRWWRSSWICQPTKTWQQFFGNALYDPNQLPSEEKNKQWRILCQLSESTIWRKIECILLRKKCSSTKAMLLSNVPSCSGTIWEIGLRVISSYAVFSIHNPENIFCFQIWSENGSWGKNIQQKVTRFAKYFKNKFKPHSVDNTESVRFVNEQEDKNGWNPLSLLTLAEV